MEALIPVVEGRMPLLITVNRASDIREALALARDEKLKLILESASEGWRVAGEIAAAGVPVLLTPIENTPASLEMLGATRSEEHTSELQSLMRISYAVFCLKKKKKK